MSARFHGGEALRCDRVWVWPLETKALRVHGWCGFSCDFRREPRLHGEAVTIDLAVRCVKAACHVGSAARQLRC